MMRKLVREVRRFARARDWEQFHSPKNLAIGIAVEAGELLEVFLWLSEHESRNLTRNQLLRTKEEIGDVMIHLANLADKLGLDLVQCALEKIKSNQKKYPARLVKGSAKKYTEYLEDRRK